MLFRSLSVASDEAHGVTFVVEDTGIGIEADQIEVALTPFGQVDTNVARKYDGVGLGFRSAKSL